MTSMKLAIALLTTLLALQACTKQGIDPAKVQADVAKAQAEGAAGIADAQTKLERIKNEINHAPMEPNVRPTTGTPPTSVEAPGTAAIPIDPAQRLADAQFDLEKAKAEQTYNVAIAHCEDRVGDANKGCRDLAKALYDQTIEQAKAKTKATRLPTPTR